MVREVAIFKFKSNFIAQATHLLEEFAAYKRTRPGCRQAAVNVMVKDLTLPYLDTHAVLMYAEYDDLKCLAETSHSLQEHFHLHNLPLQDYTVGPPIYGIFES
jgi:hypothetical protein